MRLHASFTFWTSIAKVSACLALLLLTTNSAQAYPQRLPQSNEMIPQVVTRLFPTYRLVGSSDHFLRSSISSETSGENDHYVFQSGVAPHGTIQVSLIEHEQPNAFATPAHEELHVPPTIHLSKSIFTHIKSLDELAFIIGHEMSHIQRDHFLPDIPFAMLTSKQIARMDHIHQTWELEADRDALTWLRDSGFRTSPAIALLKRLDSIADKDLDALHHRHPNIDVRVALLGELHLSQHAAEQLHATADYSCEAHVHIF